MIEILSVLTIPYMVIMSRAHGGGWPKLPFGLDAWLLAAPYFLFTPVVGYWIIPAYLMAVLGLRIGHGRGFHYNLPFEPGSKPERVEAIIPDRLPVYWQKFLIMALTGLAVTIGLGLALLTTGYVWSGVILCIAGALKAVAYLLPKTENSEYLRGLFLSLGIILALWLS